MSIARVLNRGQRRGNARIESGVIQFVFAIVRQKKFQSFADGGFINLLSSQRALNENGRTVADIAGDHVVGKFGTSNVAQRGVHRMHQVKTGIYQRAVEIEDDELDGTWIKGTTSADHEFPE